MKEDLLFCFFQLLQTYLDSHRPQKLENWCLAHCVAWYSATTQTATTNEVEANVLDGDANGLQTPTLTEIVASAPDVISIELPSLTCYMKKRTKQAVIRYHKFCLGTERELLYYSELQMFKPWRREEVELVQGKQSYEDSYNDNLNIINANKSFIQHHTTLIDDAIREIEEHGPPEDAWNKLAPQQYKTARTCLLRRKTLTLIILFYNQAISYLRVIHRYSRRSQRSTLCNRINSNAMDG